MAHYHLKTLDTGRSAIYCLGDVYGPAVMLAYGHGFISPDLIAHPEINEFLTGERESLPKDVMPTKIIRGKSTAAEYHRYLLYTMAAIWRLTGVSWRNLEPMLAFMMGWCAIAAYGLMRLGMNRLLSFVLAVLFTTSPAMLFVLPNLRDFSKAPFLLTILLGLGWLLKTQLSTAKTFFLSIALGILTGVGMGFRQDALTFVPLAIAVLVAVSIARYRANLVRVFLPAIAYFVCFVITAWPMLTRMEGGAGPDHHLIQGFSVERLDNLGVYSPVYKPVLSGADEYIFTTVYDYGRRVVEPPMEHFSLDSPGAEKAGRAWLTNLALHFPADLLVRGYASALRTLRYADAYPPAFQEPTKWHTFLYDTHRIVAQHMLHWGPIYGISVLLLIASQNIGLALGLFISSLYLFGYVSLQCEHRHAFYLSFFVFWIVGFLIHHIFIGLRKLGKGKNPDKAIIKSVLFKMALFSACCALMLFVPLYVLRVYQNHKAKALFEPYMTAPRELLPTTRHDRYGWSLFSVEAPLRDPNASDIHSLCRCIAMLQDINLKPWNVRSRYMVAEFSPDADISWLILKFETDNEKPNFTQRIHFPEKPQSKEPIQIYFPAYELLRSYHPDYRKNFYFARNHFAGIEIPEDQAKKFLGLYEITDLEKCPYLFTLSVPKGKLPDQLYHRIHFIVDPIYYYQSETGPITYMGMAEAAKRFGRKDEAVFLLRSMLPLSRDPEILRHVIVKMVEIGELDLAFASIREIHDMTGKSVQEMEDIVRWLVISYIAENNPQQSEKALTYLELANPEGQPELWLDLAHSYVKADLNKNALDKFRYLVTKYPNFEPGITQASAYVREHYELEAQIAIWRQWLDEAPKASLLWLYLGNTLMMSGNKEDAAKAYAAAYEYDPQNAEVTIQYAVTHVLQLGMEKVAHLVRQSLEQQPQFTAAAVQQIERVAGSFAVNDKNEITEALYALIADYAQEKEHVTLLRAEALIALERYDDARELLLSLINTTLSENVAAHLDRMFRMEKTPEETAASWEELAQSHPDNTYMLRYLKIARADYGRTLFDRGKYIEAASMFDLSCGEHCSDPLLETYRIITSIATSVNSEGMMHIKAHVEAHPEIRALAVEALLSVTEFFETMQRYDDAILLALAATELSPEQGTPWLVAGRIEEARMNLENAKVLYRQALEKVKNTDLIAAMIDERYRNLYSNEERRGVWEELVAGFPENTVMLMRLAIALDDDGKSQEALPHFEKVAAIYSTQGDFLIKYGEALAKTGYIGEGISRIAAGLKQEPKWANLAVDSIVKAGDAQIESNHPEIAVRLYHLAALCRRNDPVTNIKLGQAYQENGQIEGAEQAFRRVILYDPEAPVAHEAAQQWNKLLKSDAQPMKRIIAWKEIYTTLPKAALPAKYYMLALADAGNTADAITVCKDMLDAMPQSPDFRMAQGALLCDGTHIEEGLQIIKQVMAETDIISSDIIDLTAASANILAEQGQYTAAECLLNAALEMQPHNLWHQVHLGEVLMAQEHYEQALVHFRQVLTVAPESPLTAAQIDVIYDKLEKPDLRINEWRQLTTIHPESPTLQQHLLHAVEYSGNPTKQ